MSICFDGLSSLPNADEAEKTATTLIGVLLSESPDDLSVVPESTFGEIAKVDTFLVESQLSIGSASYDLTDAERIFIKVFEHEAAEYRNRVKRTWSGMVSRLEAKAREARQAAPATPMGGPAGEAKAETKEQPPTDSDLVAPGGAIPDDSTLSADSLAELFKVDKEALRKRLARLRGKDHTCFIEVADRTSTEPQFLYKVGKVRPVVEALRASGSASGNRPAEKN